MTDQILIEVIKAIVGLIIGSGITSYFFTRKLKRLSGYERAVDDMLKALIEGTEQVSDRANLLKQTIQKVEIILRSAEIDLSYLQSIQVDLETQAMALKEAINTHRIYLTPLLPFGESSHVFNSINSISAGVSLLATYLPSMNESDRADALNTTIAEIAVYYDIHRKLCTSISAILAKLNSGKDIFI
ncbi:hypothetical protein Nit79A3_2005 [Nitrosomonas sp. Is79A3]|uniref:hypothetical protein n=1 Tax=Nitrosomonas sp. (strain Is79A3) TaxID=261292 RepID=UPI000215CF12